MFLAKIAKLMTLDRDKKILFFLYVNIFLKALNQFYNALGFSLKRNNNRLIYTADGSINHGGIVDRMKGTLTTYYLSKKYNFNFHIYHNSPLPFSEIWDNEQVNLKKLTLNPFKFKIIFISTLSKLEKFSDDTLKEQKTYLVYCAENILAYQYDIVCNGIELSSGAIRNHKPELMYKLFSIAGDDKNQVDEKFSGMINALSYGAPPHGGIAPGIDRIVMLLADEKNIREVTLFPMNQNAQELMMQAPSEVNESQLK